MIASQGRDASRDQGEMLAFDLFSMVHSVYFLIQLRINMYRVAEVPLASATQWASDIHPTKPWELVLNSGVSECVLPQKALLLKLSFLFYLSVKFLCFSIETIRLVDGDGLFSFPWVCLQHFSFVGWGNSGDVSLLVSLSVFPFFSEYSLGCQAAYWLWCLALSLMHMDDIISSDRDACEQWHKGACQQ